MPDGKNWRPILGSFETQRRQAGISFEWQATRWKWVRVLHCSSWCLSKAAKDQHGSQSWLCHNQSCLSGACDCGITSARRWKYTYPTIRFSEAWQTASDKDISPRPRELGWRILHNVLPVNSYLHHLGITKSMSNESAETIALLFFNCPVVRPIWGVLDDWLTRVSGKLFKTNVELVTFYQFSSTIEAGTKKLAVVISAEIKQIVWIARIAAKFEGKRQTTASLRRHLVSAVSGRIKADHARQSGVAFEQLWCQKGVLAAIDENNKLIDKIDNWTVHYYYIMISFIVHQSMFICIFIECTWMLTVYLWIWF